MMILALISRSFLTVLKTMGQAFFHAILSKIYKIFSIFKKIAALTPLKSQIGGSTKDIFLKDDVTPKR